MGWLFGKKPRAEWRDKPQAITSAIPRDDDRAGPVPPPPRTAHPPGVAIHAFADVPEQSRLRLGSGIAGFFLEGEEGKDRPSALLVLFSPGGDGSAAAAGEAAAPPLPSAGDVLIWTTPGRSEPAGVSPSPSYAFEEISKSSLRPSHHIRRDDLSGRGVSGITGLRARHAAGGITVLRLGPPPGARWVFVGLRAIAVFGGKFTLVDGEESKVAAAGHIALVSDPTATLYVEAGNDSALAVALGGARVVSALG
jgi:hypothetical protein